MKYEGYYYLLFFVFVGILLIVFYYNMLQQQRHNQQLQNLQQYHMHQHKVMTSNPAKDAKYTNADDDHIKLYKDDSIYKKTNNINNYTYNIENVDILKGNTSNSDNRLGSQNHRLYDPELDEVYNTTLRGTANDPNETIEIYNYSVKPNKTDLPIVNAPLHLLQTDAPLRLSEKRHSM
jgi:preprotein translocase subunit YajC